MLLLALIASLLDDRFQDDVAVNIVLASIASVTLEGVV